MTNKLPLTKENIIELLKEEKNKEHVKQFAAYCVRIKMETKDGALKNQFMQKKTADEMADLYRRVDNEGLVFDGVHITLQKRGINYDYVAYKNKMLLVYPESIIDIQLVYEGDKFTPMKKDGEVSYIHEMGDPFNRADNKIIGGYCVIKNKRGNFLTILNKEDFEKHRKVAQTDYIWKQWFAEMCLKTLMRKATKMHFDDVFATMNEEDNAQYDLENSLDIELEWKQEIESINTIDELRQYNEANKGRGKEFAAMIAKRQSEISKAAFEKEKDESVQ